MACFYAEAGRQAPRKIIQIMNEFLAAFSNFFVTSYEILCDRDLFNSFTFLHVHPLCILYNV